MSILKSIETVKNSPFILKNMKSMPSRDGVHWTATIYEGTKKVGTVEDEGRGGMVDVCVDAPTMKRLATLHTDPTYSEAAGSYLSALADHTDLVNRLKRACKTKTLVRTPTSGPDSYTEFKLAFSPAVKGKIADHLKSKGITSFVVLNEIL